MYIIQYVNVFFWLLFFFNSELISGRWDLVEFTAIESIRNSDGYLLADFETQALADQKFQLALDSVRYEFKKDTLYYTDIEDVNIVHRRAKWKIIGDTLFVKEIDRIYLRKYFIRKVSQDSLVFSSIFNGKPARSSYIFSRDEK